MTGTRQNAAVVAMTMMFCALLCWNMINAYTPKTWIVGDEENGWDEVIPMDSWAEGKKFYAGDILVFKYDYQGNNVVKVNRTGYETCIANEGSQEYDTGNDRIQLSFGGNYFIGTTQPEDCSAGWKLAINATAPPPSA